MNLRPLRWLPLLGLAATACAGEAGEPDCSEDRCGAAESREELLAALEGHANPIADMLRAQSTDAGTIAGDYNDILTSLGDIVGCAADTEKSFVVLSNTGFIPKTVFARCADSPQAASRFFVAAPTADAGDMDPRILHLTGWDEDAKRYRHYATGPSEDGGMEVNVQPSFCLGCHGGPERLDYWQPLMNEMTNPWSGWNAEPGFQSQLFDDYLDGEIAAGPVYGEMLAPSRLDSASNLEPLVRAGIARTVGARVLTRNHAASAPGAERESLDLLRPIFCDETVNYVSEVHRSGELRIDAIVDLGIRDLLARLFPAATWSWRGQASVLLPALEAGQDPVTLIATRATISVELEKALLARGVFDELELLRARQIDWQNPIGSEDRCGVYRAGRARIEGGALADQVNELAVDAEATALARLFYDEILRDHPRPSLASAELLGDAIDQRIASFGELGAREPLRQARDARGCWAAEFFFAAPIIPDLSCP